MAGEAVTIDFDRAIFDRRFTEIEKKNLPYAASLALNETAFGARKAVQGQMRGDLDRPTPYALRGVVYEKSTKRDLRAAVVIYGNKAARGGLPAAYFLGPQVFGGMRSHKAFESQLIDRGLMMTNEVAVPASAMKLDRYGNMSQGQLNKVMSGLKVDYRGAGSTRVAATDKGKAKARKAGRYFVPPRGSHLAPGIWFEKPTRGKQIMPLILFVRQTIYAPRLKFDAAVNRHVQRNLVKNFNNALRRAVASSRS